ncbi:inovirus Gp2 family protein [Agarivorans sp. B2Z047]|uniref:inovirus Gp2 family protein n=1 Tax=Agarivorans sp. B2Z047 TaxID=2652721 RepID=UPI00128C1D7F|nr:inovirus Gp2 family protein [Agarivorans sp. B2Z047]MPW31883.1 inovirus Gp2 family protein [Agarivorans sp. B2Z047]UQN43680.1 inovirus Gp2 family protein [Agarivorans sp. B2Z047]
MPTLKPLHTDSHYAGYPVYLGKGPLFRCYLDATFNTLQRAIAEHPRTFAIRVDLRLPQNGRVYNNQVITRFIKSLNSQLQHNRKQAALRLSYAHPNTLRYIWCREQQTGEQSHFHVLLLLNADAFDRLGLLTTRQGNMAARITRAWVSALGFCVHYDWDDIAPLVHFCKNGTYLVGQRHDDRAFNALFFRASYLSKKTSKYNDYHQHAFGCSRK